jgi:hypothetical protein
MALLPPSRLKVYVPMEKTKRVEEFLQLVQER